MNDLTQSSGFSPEQIAALVSALQKLPLGDTSVAAGPSVYGVPLDELCSEEVAKYQQHPMDLWPRLQSWTTRGEMATGLDQFLLRHLGFFNVEPASPGYMVRLRLPACQLGGDQLQALADIAENFAGGYGHITTRGNIQLREIAPDNVLNVLSALTRAGLSCQGSGADSARNLTTSPTAGFDAQEIIDLAPYAQRLSDLILHTRELRALPRKFNISFDNGGAVSAVSDSNDICFQAIQVCDEAPVPAGHYCRISVGGISGHGDLTRETGFVCTPEQTVLAGTAMLNVFVAHADRTNRKRARLKYLLDRLGVEWFVEQTQQELKALDAGFELTALPNDYDLPRPAIDRQAHIGPHPQADKGRYYLGVALQMGRLEAEQMRVIGQLAEQYGDNQMRLTVWQNLLIPHLSESALPTVIGKLTEHGMDTKATAFAAGAVACTGKTACKLGLAHTKEDGLALVRHLESLFTLDQPLNIHLTGCPNSCAQHYIGDIGLVGVTLPDGTEGYHLVLGGGSDQDKGVGRPACGPMPAGKVNAAVEQIVGLYLNQRQGHETFLQYIRRQPDEVLPTLIDVRQLAA
ncbi:MAG: NirA family protein [Pseudomonadales bacterium]